MGAAGWDAMRSMRRADELKGVKLSRGVKRRILRFARPYRRDIAVFIALVTFIAAIGVATPVLAGDIVNELTGPGGTQRGVVAIAAVIAGLALLEGLLNLAMRWYGAKLGEGIIFDLRRAVFDHVQSMPVAFFTRSQTGALVSRLNNDVMGAQRAFTSTLSGLVSNGIAVALIIGVMFFQSWQITLLSLVLVPVFLVPAKWVGRKLAELTKESFDLNAAMNTQMAERFNVGGAMLVKLFGRPDTESAEFADRADRVRGIGITTAMYARTFIVALTVVAGLSQALAYGLGGAFVFAGQLSAGTVVTLALLLTRLYGPLTALSNVRVDVMSALVSFQRVFEVLDLKPLIHDKPDARELPAGAASIRFRDVGFRYPGADQVSLASLEDLARPDRSDSGRDILRGVSVEVAPGELVALVGHSGAGKTTMASLVPRLYDVTAGAVEVGGVDVRDLKSDSLASHIGMVTQDAHLFHDTVRENLRYARPEASDDEIWEALDRAQIGDTVRRLESGLDTVVGERGYRFSGGEKQRLAIARVLLKAPPIVILDEATAHLDSESEAAVQRALDTALEGRTSLVIAHRLSTVRRADKIVVLEDGEVVESGTHDDLVARGGLYAELYRTQFEERGEDRSGSGERGEDRGAGRDVEPEASVSTAA
ncbi:ATP-binding cassette domain-containing protein [Glycomyces sp. NEAU-7082]|uniref:ATP-binding cassette domain-containing protein n=2 Tax=Glycomyces albidus TaxID=2656774 RepID=A0A6L5GAU2_9ACTN|nr:ABC transporter ATP-binding protein [Glycomyces albidus]MQM26799.1 ATP-binding cassette domain-containing protein [Glycomyces albidus]